MKKSIKLLKAIQFADLAIRNLDALMKDDTLSDKEYNTIREAHDYCANARDLLTKNEK